MPAAQPVPSSRWRARVAPPDVAFALLCLLLGAIRWSVLVESGAPPGIDGGNWLAIGRALLGGVTGVEAAAYPPVVPALLAGAVGLVGPLHGTALVAALASLAPAAGSYVALRRGGLRWPAVALAVLLAPLAATGEATAWGGYPQLLATGGGVVALSMLDRHLRRPTRGRALAAGAALAAVLATSHFVGLVVLLGAAVLVVLHRTGAGDTGATGAQPVPRPRWHLVLVALPSIALVPLYVTLATSMLDGYGSRPSVVRVTPRSLLADLEFAYREAPLLWRPLVALAVLTPLLAGPLRRRPLWAVGSSLVPSIAAVLVATGEIRSLHLLPVAAVLCAGFWTEAWRSGAQRLRRSATVGLAAALVAVVSVASIRGLDLFADQRPYYQVLEPGVVEGVEWLRAHTSPGEPVAVASVNGAPLGWWVEALGRRPVLSGSALQWLYREPERERARMANRIFGPSFPDDAAMEVARGAGVAFLVVATSADAYREDRVEAFRRSNHGSLAFQNDDVVILAVPGV